MIDCSKLSSYIASPDADLQNLFRVAPLLLEEAQQKSILACGAAVCLLLLCIVDILANQSSSDDVGISGALLCSVSDLRVWQLV